MGKHFLVIITHVRLLWVQGPTSCGVRVMSALRGEGSVLKTDGRVDYISTFRSYVYVCFDIRTLSPFSIRWHSSVLFVTLRSELLFSYCSFITQLLIYPVVSAGKNARNSQNLERKISKFSIIYQQYQLLVSVLISPPASLNPCKNPSQTDLPSGHCSSITDKPPLTLVCLEIRAIHLSTSTY